MNFTKSHGLLILASFCFSFILVFSTLLKNVGVSSLQQALFRVVLALPLILVLIKGKINLEKKDLPYFVLIGFIFSAFIFSALSSIAFGCPIAVSVALIYTQPFFTAILAVLSKKEKVTPRKFMIILVGMFGALLASGILTEQYSTLSIVGILFALLAGFLYATYLFLKRMLKRSYTPLQGLFNTFLFAALCSFILGLASHFFITDPKLMGFSIPDLYQLLLLILFAFFSTTLPYGLLNYVKVGEVPPTTEGTILLLDPFLHNVWAVLIFQQYVSLVRYLGIGLTLLSAAAMLRMRQ
ncbi:MAG: DMT family transporter [Candidatus Bathyarchaeia archaeon]